MTGQRRVVVISFAYQPHTHEKVQSYVNLLAERGILVDFLVFDDERWAELVDPRIRLHAFRPFEDKLVARRAERLAIYKIPGWTIATTHRAAGKIGLGRLSDRTLPVAQRAHRFFSGNVHRRLYAPTYRLLRPNLLNRMVRKQLADFDMTGVERIVVADPYGTKVGWELARRAPNAIATTALDRKPYEV
jgi:hypothetical protein